MAYKVGLYTLASLFMYIIYCEILPNKTFVYIEIQGTLEMYTYICHQPPLHTCIYFPSLHFSLVLGIVFICVTRFAASGFVCQSYSLAVDLRGACFMHFSDQEPSHFLACSPNGKFFASSVPLHGNKSPKHSGHAKCNGHVYMSKGKQKH